MANSKNENEAAHINEEFIKLILSKHESTHDGTDIENYSVHKASDKMLGFLCDYWKIKVHLTNRKVLYFFIKAISRTNASKANMVKEMKLFDKEVMFYSEIKKKMEVPGVKPWSAALIAALDDALVFEDLNAMQYKLRNKFDRFDTAHTLQALSTLARFHAASIIFEENKTKEQRKIYRINKEYTQSMDKGGYQISSEWFIQCMAGALEAMKSFSKYTESEMNLIESRWRDVWRTALCLGDPSSEIRNVVCHRDLWNNNIMFHYIKVGENQFEPDDCVFVDFQATRYQPAAGDVMLLLCCNLDPRYREDNMKTFLDYYYEDLHKILLGYAVDLGDVMNKREFLTSAEQQRQWGLVLCACLMPQFWVDDDLSTKIFCENAQFNEILSKNKGMFIKEMMKNNIDYKLKVMEIFEEIADRYCLFRNGTPYNSDSK